MKIDDRVYVHGYVDEIRKDTVIIRNEGGYFGTVKSEIVEAQKAEDIVSVIRCKDCRFRDSELACTQFDAYTSVAGDLFSPPDWFYCGYGKRKEE